MQSDFKNASSSTIMSLAELLPGQEARLERIELPEDVADRLMELGFLPGTTIRVEKVAPGGDPKVFRVDGAEIALRSETAKGLRVVLKHHRKATFHG